MPYDRKAEIEKANREYHPCDCGVHVCGHIEDEDSCRPLTLANFPRRNEEEARELFNRLRQFAASDGEPEDCCVDLNIGDWNYQVEDFQISRQMLELLTAEANK